MTRDEFAKGFARLTMMFPVPHTEEDMINAWFDTWFKLLEPIPATLFYRGVTRVLATHRYHTFPTPAQVIDVLKDVDIRRYGRLLNLTPDEKLEVLRPVTPEQRRKMLAPAATVVPVLPERLPSREETIRMIAAMPKALRDPLGRLMEKVEAEKGGEDHGKEG